MSLWHLRDYASARRRYSRSTFALDVRSRRLLSRSHGFSQIRNSAGGGKREEPGRMLAYNASIKAKRQALHTKDVAVLREFMHQRDD